MQLGYFGVGGLGRSTTPALSLRRHPHVVGVAHAEGLAFEALTVADPVLS